MTAFLLGCLTLFYFVCGGAFLNMRDGYGWSDQRKKGLLGRNDMRVLFVLTWPVWAVAWIAYVLLIVIATAFTSIIIREEK